MNIPLEHQLPIKPEEFKTWQLEMIKLAEPSHEQLFQLSAAIFMWQDYANALEEHVKKIMAMLMTLGVEHQQLVNIMNTVHDALHSEPETPDNWNFFEESDE